MSAQGDHARNDIEWRFHMDQSRFARPGTEARNSALLVHDNCTVLMPTEGPIGRCGLVK